MFVRPGKLYQWNQRMAGAVHHTSPRGEGIAILVINGMVVSGRSNDLMRRHHGRHTKDAMSLHNQNNNRLGVMVRAVVLACMRNSIDALL